MQEIPSENEAFPPLAPTGEGPAPSDPSFVADCLAEIAKISRVQPIEVGPHSVTLNRRWGPVFRADYTTDQDEDSDLLNRLVFWKDESGKNHLMLAVGQDLSPIN